MNKTKRKNTLKYLTKVGILSALAAVLMLFEFPLPFIAPPFYKLDLSEIVVLVGSFALGPAAGVLIELLKNLINLLITGTTTAFVGEFANFVTGCVFVLPAALLYCRKKTLPRALIGMGVGTASLAILGAILNYFVMIPFYSNLYMLPMGDIVAMGHAIIPAIHDLLSFVLLAVVPFNLIKGILCSVMTALLYKHVSPVLHK